jgi:hypothetical protein
MMGQSFFLARPQRGDMGNQDGRCGFKWHAEARPCPFTERPGVFLRSQQGANRLTSLRHFQWLYRVL